jgi:hypothetical protein
MRNRRNLLNVQTTPEFLRVIAARNAGEIARYGWRPSAEDLTLLRNSTQDAVAYRICARAWKRAGFRVLGIKKLAGRTPVRP